MIWFVVDLLSSKHVPVSMRMMMMSDEERGQRMMEGEERRRGYEKSAARYTYVLRTPQYTTDRQYNNYE
jgi:hypothetical protein